MRPRYKYYSDLRPQAPLPRETIVHDWTGHMRDHSSAWAQYGRNYWRSYVRELLREAESQATLSQKPVPLFDSYYVERIQETALCQDK